MKRIAIADLHFSRYKDDEEILGLPERLHSLLSSLEYVCSFAREHDIKDIDIAGDIVDDKSIIYSIAQKLLLDFFETNEDLSFRVLAGNHDMSDRTTKAICALEFLRSLPNVKLIAYEPFYDEQLDILYVPDSPNMVRQIISNKAKILISHIGLSEAQLSSGISIVSDLKLSQLKPYEVVLLGHYHKVQELITDYVKCYYVGSLIHLDWNDANDPKRFLVYDTETLEVQSIESKGYKKFVHLKIEPNNIQTVTDEAKKLMSEGHHVLLIKDENFDTSDIEDDFVVVDKSEKELTDRGVSLAMTQDEILRKYCEVKGIVDPESYISYLKSIIEKSGIQDSIGHATPVSVKFQEARMGNIMAFSEEMVLEDLDQPALVVIGGRNGAGKSSLFESIYWCLYGTSPRGLRGDEIVNSQIGKNCFSELKFQIDKGNGDIDNYEVRRYYKHSRFRNKVFLIKNGTDISGSSNAETKKKIESILVSEKVFSNCVFFAQKIEDFFVRVPDSEKKLVLSKILDLEKYFQWRELVKQDRDEINSKIETLEVKKQVLEDSLESVLTDIEDQKRLKKEFFENKARSLKEKQDAIKAINLEIVALEESLKKFPSSLEEELELELKKSSTITSQLDMIREQYSLKVDNLEREFRSRALEFKSSLEREKESLSLEKEKRLSELTESDLVKDLEFKISTKEFEIQSLSNEIDSVSKQIQQKQSDLQNLKIVYPEELFSLTNQMEKETSEIKSLDSKLEELQEAIKDPQKVTCPLGLDCPVILNKEEIDKIKFEIDNITKQITEKQEILKELSDKVLVLKEEAKKEHESLKMKISDELRSLEVTRDNLLTRKESLIEESDRVRAELKVELNRINQEKQEIERNFSLGLGSLKKRFEQFKVELSKELNQKRNDLYQELIDKNEELGEQLQKIKDKISEIREKIQSRDEIQNKIQDLSSKISTLKAEIDLISEQDFDTTLLSNLEIRQKDLTKSITDLEIELHKLESLLEIANFWYDGLSATGVVSLLLDSAIPFINERIKYYLEILAGNKFTVSIDTLKRLKGKDEFRDKIDVQVINNLTKGNVTKMLSGGEVRLIDLCFMFTFRDLLQKMKNISFSCMFLDEILDALDEEISKRVNKLLKLLSQELRVFLITHRLFSELEVDELFTL